jgi:hypothetical protein
VMEVDDDDNDNNNNNINNNVYDAVPFLRS